MFLLHFTLSDKVPEKGIKYDKVLQVRYLFHYAPFFQAPLSMHLACNYCCPVAWASVPNELTMHAGDHKRGRDSGKAGRAVRNGASGCC